MPPCIPILEEVGGNSDSLEPARSPENANCPAAPADALPIRIRNQRCCRDRAPEYAEPWPSRPRSTRSLRSSEATPPSHLCPSPHSLCPVPECTNHEGS